MKILGKQEQPQHEMSLPKCFPPWKTENYWKRSQGLGPNGSRLPGDLALIHESFSTPHPLFYYFVFGIRWSGYDYRDPVTLFSMPSFIGNKISERRYHVRYHHQKNQASSKQTERVYEDDELWAPFMEGEEPGCHQLNKSINNG